MSSQHLRSRGTGRRVFGSWVLSVTFTTVFCVTHSSSRLCAQDARELQKAKKETREKLFEKMRTRAETTKVYSLADNKRTEAKLVPQPIFRYSDQPRFIVDATMWVWGTKGRPIAMCKVERYRQPNREWLYCMASLSPGLIEIQWQSGRRWTFLFECVTAWSGWPSALCDARCNVCQRGTRRMAKDRALVCHCHPSNW